MNTIDEDCFGQAVLKRSLFTLGRAKIAATRHISLFVRGLADGAVARNGDALALLFTTLNRGITVAAAILFVSPSGMGSPSAVHFDVVPTRNSTQNNAEIGAFVGILTADRTSNLQASLDGVIVSISAKRGDRVVAGQTLVRMVSPTLSPTDLAVAEGQVRRARADDSLTRLEYQKALSREARVASLLEQNLVSRQQAEEAHYDVLLAGARIAAAEAAVDYAEAMARRQSELLSQLEARAPFSGVITEQFANVGMSVTRGAALLRIISPQPLRVKFAIPAAAQAALRAGTALSLRLRNPEMRLTARVESISVEVDSASQTFTAEGIVDTQRDAGAASNMVGRSVTVSIVDSPNRE